MNTFNPLRILFRTRSRQQGMTEYIIIVGLIAIVLIAAVGKFGGIVGVAFSGGTTKVDGVGSDIDSVNTGGGTSGSGGADDDPVLPNPPDDGSGN